MDLDILRDIAGEAVTILVDADLPHRPDWLHECGPDRAWRPLEEAKWADISQFPPPGYTWTMRLRRAARALGVEEGAREDYAAWALDDIEKIRRELRDGGDPERACRLALELAQIVTECRFVTEWGREHALGTKQLPHLDQGRRQANAERHDKRASEWGRWQEAADLIWKNKPRLSKSAVAAAIKARLRLDASIRTIRDRLHKPGEAG